jgi:O-antigen ligase
VTEDGRTRILRWFLLGATAATGLSWLAVAGFIRTRSAGPDNPAVTMSHLDLSMVLAVAALIALDEVARSASWRHRLVATGAVVWIASGLAINIGRSGQLAFVGAASVWAGTWMARRSRRAAVAAIVLVWCTLGLVYASVPRVRERVGDAVAEIRAAVDHDRYATNQGMRVAGMIVSWDLVRDRPWFGSGVGDTLYDFATVLDERHPKLAPVLDQFRHQHLHNQYLQIAVELGFAGLATLLALLVSLVVHRPRRAADRALLAGLSVAFALGFLGDPFLRKQMPLATFALVAGVLTAVTNRDEEQSPRSQSESASRPKPASTSRR